MLAYQRPARRPTSRIEEEQTDLAPAVPADIALEEIALLLFVQEYPFRHSWDWQRFYPRSVERDAPNGAGLPLRPIVPDQVAGEPDRVADVRSPLHNHRPAWRIEHGANR